MDKKIKILIGGGGTGGHIFPAIAIANAIKRLYPEAEILFIGALGKMEMEKVPEAGYPIRGLYISGFQRNLSAKNFIFPFKLLASMFQAYLYISRFKPHVVVGVGGFASGPSLRVAVFKGIPTLIQEQNSFPGVTNKILSGKVSKICVAFDGMDKFFPAGKIILTGNPVRKNVIEINNKREKSFRFFGLDPMKKTVLVMGGSLGARSINEVIKNNLDFFTNGDIQLIWQTGKPYYETAQNAVKDKTAGQIALHAFIKEMDLAYAAADMVISRAGAIAISELCAVKKPVIFVPYPYAAENHQYKNAMKLAENDAAVVVKDMDAPKDLLARTAELINDPERMNNLSIAIGKMARTDADIKIAEEVLKLIKYR